MEDRVESAYHVPVLANEVIEYLNIARSAAPANCSIRMPMPKAICRMTSG